MATNRPPHIKPLPPQHVSLIVQRRYTEAEMEKIRQGLLPQDMDDRWFMLFEDDTLYMHRSWTGYCVFVADFAITHDGYAVTKLLVNRKSDEYRGTDEKDGELFINLVDLLLLTSN